MVSRFALLSSLLLASAALATPSQPAIRIARSRRDGSRRSQPLSNVEWPGGAVSSIECGSNWAGAVLTGSYGMFTSVTGTFTIPSAGSTCSGAIWVGIDAYSCQNAFLQAGVDVVVENGTPSYDAWYEWYPNYAYTFSGISLNAGDVINVTVIATSTISGTVIIEDLTTGQTVTQDLTSAYALCEADAEWVVEDLEEDGTLVPFCDFGSVTFRNATATGPGGTYSPSSGNICNIEQNGQILTSVSASGETVTVTYV